MTKQAKTLITLAVIVVVCGAGYLGLRAWNESQSEADDTVYITQLSDPTALSVTNQYGGFAFTKGEEGWTRDDDSDFPTDQDALDDLADQAGKLAAVRTIADPEDLSSYGLDEPTMEVNLTDEDGTQVKLLIGSTLDSGDYYAKLDGSDTVYTIASTLPTALDIQVDELIALAEFPSLSEDNIQSVTWTSGDSTVTLVKEETESESTEDSSTDTSSDSSTDTSSDSSSDSSEEETTILWKVDGQTVSEDNTTFISLMAQLSELAFSDCYDYHKQAQTRTDCGLDTPVGVLTVVYTDGDEEKTMTLTLGALAEGGESYYAMLDDDPIIYLIPSNEIGSLFSMTVDNLTAVEETEEETDEATDTDTSTDTSSDTSTDTSTDTASE